MNRNGSYGTSWADQWDSGADPLPYHSGKNGGGGSSNSSSATEKYKKKIGEGLGKTKAVASTGWKKVKVGTSVGVQWMKDKYHKTTHKH